MDFLNIFLNIILIEDEVNNIFLYINFFIFDINTLNPFKNINLIFFYIKNNLKITF
jgi:hypothetical protein